MKQIFTLISALFIGTMGMTQAFQSDLSSWSMSDPTDWMGTKTSINSSNVNEITFGSTYGSSFAQLLNTGSGHKRFTTQSFAVTAGETYEIKMWLAALTGDIRTSFYDLTNGNYGNYGSYIDLSVASGSATPVMISQTITIPSGCTSIEAILSLRNTDATGIALDSVDISLLAITYDPKTISEIQTTTMNDSPEIGNFVKTSGVVTAVNSGSGYWIQDGIGAWSGVYIKDNANTPSRGDSVTVEGQVAENFDATQIENVGGYTLESTPSVIPMASDLSTTDLNSMEDWEGVLVRVVNGTCTNDNAGFGQWTINSSPGTANDTLLVDDDMFSYTATFNNAYNVTGIAHYAYGDRKLLPRDANDITAGTSAIEKHSFSINMYPNPATNNVMVSGIENGIYAIYNMNGSIVLNGNLNGTSNIDVSKLSSGIYAFNVIVNNKVSNTKLVIK